MIEICVERVYSISPSIFESFHGGEIILLTCSNDQVFILDGSAIFQDDLIVLRVELFNSDVVRLCIVLAEGLTSRCAEIELGDAE